MLHVYKLIGKWTWLVIVTVFSKLEDLKGHRQLRAR